MLPEFLNQIPANQSIGSVTVDVAYVTRRRHDVITSRNAHAVISPGKNARPWKPIGAGAIARNEAVITSRYLGPRHLATVERVSTTKRCRQQHALCEAAGVAAHVEGLLPLGRRNPNPCSRPRQIHISWHTLFRFCIL